MPVQKRGDGWRARRKKGSKTFAGPIRATEAAAMQDAQELDAAAAISMERLQEVHDRLSVPGVRAASDASAFGPSMSVERLRNGWRARRKMSDKTFCGPVRVSEKAANEDAQQFEEAARVSFERLQEVHDRMTCLLLASVAKHYSGWRARVSVGKEKLCGPTRSLQAQADEDCSWLRGLQHM